MDLNEELKLYEDLKVETEAISVTEEMVQNELENARITIKEEPTDRCVTVYVELQNGFILSEMSCSLSKESYSKKIGVETCMQKITSKLWMLLGFYLAQVTNKKTTK